MLLGTLCQGPSEHMMEKSDTNLARLEDKEDDNMEGDYIQEIEGELAEAKPYDEHKKADNESKAFQRKPRKKNIKYLGPYNNN